MTRVERGGILCQGFPNLVGERAVHPHDPERCDRNGTDVDHQDVARSLGNTPAVCRKSYIHPKLLEAYSGGTLRDQIAELSGIPPRSTASQSRLDDTERLVLRLLNGGA